MAIPPYHWWRTVFFLIPAISLYTIVLGTLSIASSLFEKRGYFAHGCARMWAKLILLTTGVRVDVQGLDRLTARTYVFVANHQSHYDTAILFAVLPYQLRIIAKQSLGRFPFLGWHLRRTGHLLVDRRRPDRTAIFDWAARLTSQQLSLIVYPEGTRSADGRVGRFKGGSFHIALEAGLPVVPLSVVGTRRIMQKGRLAARPGRVRLVVHEPIDTSMLGGTDPKTFGERVRQIIAPEAESDVDVHSRT
ncbi:MAG: 1-acyl-sn-glycerol-3-phosphate acyltransferase [Acidobacteria bacterium]|nr:1-acyl-sn-glycerol-3-phosphate acyltransferase [Acidobacteriota bacterium]